MARSFLSRFGKLIRRFSGPKPISHIAVWTERFSQIRVLRKYCGFSEQESFCVACPTPLQNLNTGANDPNFESFSPEQVLTVNSGYPRQIQLGLKLLWEEGGLIEQTHCGDAENEGTLAISLYILSPPR